MANIEFINFEETPSTNIYALENIENLNDRTVIFADRQTQGRGRFDRVWESGNNSNLYFSIVLKPTNSIDKNLPLANLTQYMSLVLCRVLDSYGVQSQIKWPNDVLIEGKKVAGILAETSIKGQIFKGLVVGVGVNLNSTKEEIRNINQPATSLNLELGQDIDKRIFFNCLIEAFFEGYDEFLESGFALIKNDYVQKCFFIGSQIKINEISQSYDAMANGINDDGTLNIKIDETEKNISVGDILCR
jgi:BirA family biotin operon repressor/biotin-[acetyl-CoA-carboxylase] ligase